MKYARLFTISIILFVFLSVTTIVIISQSPTRQVGTPMCEIYNSGSSKCARITCNWTGYVIPNPNPNDPYAGCVPTHPRDQSQNHCESKGGSNCEITERMSCYPDSKSATFGRSCTLADGTITFTSVDSPRITCPVSCPGCPTPSGNKPCRRAVWDTTYCKWNTDACYVGGGGCLSEKTISGDISQSIPPPPGGCAPGETWNEMTCRCEPISCPIVIDVSGNGFNLTDSTNGVHFDLNGDAVREKLSWTSMNSDDAWLALDRNNDGMITTGAELFGNFTPQPDPPPDISKNGFNALAEFDRIENGGNADGKINHQDLIFDSLRLWKDANHDGISQASEIFDLSMLDVRAIDLDYQPSRRVDEHGNQFKYRAKVRDVQGASVGRWAWDVFLVLDQP